MKKGILICSLAIGLAAAITGWAGPVKEPVSFDFSTRPDPKLASCGGAVTFADGIMKFPMEGHADLVLKNLDCTRPFQVDFTMRPIQAKATKGYFLIRVASAEPGTELLLLSHEKGNGFFAIYREKKVQRFYDFHRCDVYETTGAWKKFRLIVSETGVELYLDSRQVFSKRVKLLPVNSLLLTRNGCELEFDDFRLESAPEERTDIAQQPFPLSGSGSGVEGTAEPVPGGEAVRRELSFPVEGMFRNQSGGIMFWMTLPAFTGSRRLLSCDDAKGTALSITQQTPWETTVSIRRKDSLPAYRFALGLNPWRYGDGNRGHVALTWDREAVRLYVNSMPYSTIQYDQSNIPPLTSPDLEGIRRLRIPAGVTFDGLRFFQRPVSPREVYEEYRKGMPIDLVMQTQMFRGDEPIRMVLNAAPGGFFMRPMPVEAPLNRAKVEISAILTASGGGKELLRLEPREYVVDQPVDIPLPVTNLAPGNYLLRTSVRGNGGTVFQRTFGIDVCPPLPRPASATREDFKRGRELYSCDLVNAPPPMLGEFRRVTEGSLHYLEGVQENFGRFGFEVKFPEEAMGKPVLIEIDWPDDKPRLAAHYIYRPSQGYCDRDRLQQGIQSGIEYPLSGKMITTRYLFWPGFPEYLFEFRNLAAGRPAAVSALRIYEIEGGALPALQIEEPAGLPARTLGHLDEDQTFYMNLNRDYYDSVLWERKRKFPNFDFHVFGELGKYFSYVGMNSIQYNLLRYFYVYSMMDTDVPPGFPPEKAGGLDYMLRALKENGISFLCGINISSIPEVAHSTVTMPDAEKRGWLMGDRTGRIDGGMFGSRYPNFPTNPEIMAFYLAHIRDLATQLGRHDNVTGFALWTVPWKGLAWGYDDYNIALFTKETGIKVPEEGRYEFLTGPQREAWLRWRADRTTRLIRAIAETIHEVNPEWNLLIFPQDEGAFKDPVTQSLPVDVDAALDRKRYFYENFGMDIDALEKLDRVFFAPQLSPSKQPQKLYQYSRLEPLNELVYSAAADRNLYRRDGRSRQLAGIYHDYFESIAILHPSPTLLPEKYSCFFQDTDVKPYGRYFLKELTCQVAASDAQHIVFGAQPLGALGREMETREFAQAYRALPALPFRDIPSAVDPVAARYLPTKNGTYLYLANTLWSGVRVTVQAAGRAVEVRDLSTGETVKLDEITLEAYQLRSFLLPGRAEEEFRIEVEVPERAIRFYSDRLAELRTRLREVEAIRGEKAVAAEREVFRRAEAEVAAGHYAEAHRLLFSVLLQEFLLSTRNVREIAEMQRMLDANHIAVNCGSNEFYSTPDGRLFFPDAEFSRQGVYGYFGQHKTCRRDVDDVQDGGAPGVFETEAWDIDGYRFRVPNGRYTVKLYMRYAYAPKFKPDIPLMFTLEAQGKVLFRRLDFYRAMKGDLRNPVILEFPGVEVSDGILTLKCIAEEGDSSIRHFNAVEIIREQQPK